MKKITILFIMLAFAANNYLKAQSNRFIYEYKFKLDSLNRDKTDSENMVLDISPEGSRFYSQVKAIYDSTIDATYKNTKITQIINLILQL